MAILNVSGFIPLQLPDLLSPQGQLLMITVSENDPQGVCVSIV